ncbi:MAG: sensor histidine kinase [Deltaproteobacteria bacterium]|nr:sensor histidine kinase [Deltaproteobacteria bacterium]
MKKLLFSFLVLIVIAIGLLHFYTPGYMVFYHDTYRRLSYFPIVLGAIWFGVSGGLTLAALTSIAFIPHLLLYIGSEPQTYLSELTEIILYLLAGGVVGLIAGRESKLRQQYKLLSEKLKKSYDRLHNEAKLLIEAEEQLSVSQKLSSLGELSASLAHEVKNPLSSIKGTAEILLDEFPIEHPKREFVEILLAETSRLNATVNEVLRYSSGKGSKEGEKGKYEPLPETISRVLKLLDNRIKEKRIHLELYDIAFADYFLVDGHKMSQVFLNIVLNAIDAVSVEGKISIDGKKTSDGISVSISDNGPGISASEQARIFEAFYSGKEGGTGLGLSISQKIVKSYNGKITVSDSSSGGACLSIYLPERTFM